MISLLRVALAGLLCVATAGIACAQFTPFATVVFQHYPDRVAAPYDFEVWFTSLIDNDALTIVAPDGTTFENVPEFGVIHHELHNLTETDINRFIGSWTINDFQGLPNGAAPQKHTFNVSQSVLRRPPTLPSIIYPVDGAVLPPVFKARPSGGGLSLLTPEDEGSVKFLSYSTPPVERTYQYLFNPGVTEAQIEARAINQDISIGGASAPQQANRRFSVWTIKDIYAPPVTFTVRVPEPATISLGCIALISLAALRRRE